MAAIGHSSVSAQWSLTGNGSTTPGTNFLGTTDNKELILKTNNVERFRIAAGGNVGIGTNNPQGLLHIANGDVLLQNTLPGYTPLRIKNGDGSKTLLFDYASIFQYGGNCTIRVPTNHLVLNDADGGYVGIGTSDPKEKLSVAGSIYMQGANNYFQVHDRLTLQVPNTEANGWTRSLIGQNIKWNPVTNKWKVDAGPYDDFSMVRFENGGTIGFYARHYTGSSYEMTDEALKEFRRMGIDFYGNVGIGTTETYGHKLAVNGSAIFTSVKVKLRENWADYVFEKDYELMPIAELEKFIQQNKHLPGIPTAAEVEKKGLDLGVNQAALLKKIEELTLYIIDQNKKMEQMQSRIISLEKKVR
jgi:hypothetical protein